MQKTITARALITADSEILFPVLHLDEDGCLLEIGSDPESLAHESTILASALLDVHMHGGKGIDVMHADESHMGIWNNSWHSMAWLIFFQPRSLHPLTSLFARWSVWQS